MAGVCQSLLNSLCVKCYYYFLFENNILNHHIPKLILFGTLSIISHRDSIIYIFKVQVFLKKIMIIIS